MTSASQVVGPPGAAGGRATAPSLVRSSAVMAVGTVASRILGLVRNLVLAAAIGSFQVGDSFAVANTVPNMVYLLLVGGVINAVFVPQLVRALREHSDGGRAYTDRLLTLTGLALAAITVVATLGAPFVVDLAWHGSGSGHTLAVLLAYWCLPQIFFYGVYTVLGQVLNARGSFGPMMWAPVVNNVVAIATGLLMFGTTIAPRAPASVSFGEAALLGVGTTLGVVAQAAVLVPYLRRAGYHYRPRFDFRGAGLGKAGSLARWTIGFVLVNQAAYLVVTRVATAAGRAFPQRAVGINAYQNAFLFFMLPHSVITVSLVTALLPTMSAAASAGHAGQVRELLSRTLRLVAVALVPASAGLMLLGSTLGGVLFGYGKNGHADGVYIGLLLAAFAAGLVPFACHHVLLRSFYAYEDTRTPFFLACAISAVTAVTALAIPPLLPAEWRTLSLAVAYSVTYWFGLALTVTAARRRLGGLDGTRVLRTYVRVTVAAALATLVAGLTLWGLRAALGTSGVVAQLVEVTVAGLLLVLAYLVACRAMRVREVPELVGSLVARGR